MEITYTIEQFVSEIRDLYKSIIGEFPSSDNYGMDNAIERWLKDLYRYGVDTSEQMEILSGMTVTQYGDLALFHYVDFSIIYGEWNPEEYWNAHGGIYRTCRSTVIDLSNGETVIKPFDKFFNIGELPETSIETVERLIDAAKIVEFSNKLDGSIFCLSTRIVDGKREILTCTSKSLNPETSMHLALGRSLYLEDPAITRMVGMLEPRTTFIFEIIAKEDLHVVHYPDDMRGLYLIGVREPYGRLMTYNELIELAGKFGVKTTEILDKNLSDVLGSLDEKSSDEAEGFVIRIDNEFFKLKYNDYVRMHKTINRLVSSSGVIEAFKDGKIDDLVSKVPITYKDKIIDIVEKIASSSEAVRRVQQKAVSKCIGKDLKDQMLWIQKNVPKILQGRCINAVKYKDFGLFSERSKGVLKMRDIEEIGNAATDWLRKQRPSEYVLVYGSASHNTVTEGDFLNFGKCTDYRDEYLNY